MTRRQIERAAQGLHELAIALCLGSWTDLVIVSSRVAVDVAGISLSLLLFASSLKLTGRLGGPRI